MPSTERFWHTTKSAFLATEGCATVGFDKSMWTVTIDGARILLGAHIDDFVIAPRQSAVLDTFRARHRDACEGTYEGALQHYLCGNARRGQGYYISVLNSLRRGDLKHLQFLECHSSRHSNAAEHALQ